MKQRVQYIDVGQVEVGKRARVIPIDHPTEEFNYRWVTSGLVEDVNETPAGLVFTTKNSIYRPAPTEDPVGFSLIGLLNAIFSGRQEGKLLPQAA